MNDSRMKNIIVLKDLPSNLVDEAIVILKHGIKVKDRKFSDNKGGNDFKERQDSNYETAIQEAEFLVRDYIQRLEKPNDIAPMMRKLKLKYKKLQLCSLFLGLTTIVRHYNISF